VQTSTPTKHKTKIGGIHINASKEMKENDVMQQEKEKTQKERAMQCKEEASVSWYFSSQPFNQTTPPRKCKFKGKNTINISSK
jgi:hypothetical protein